MAAATAAVLGTTLTACAGGSVFGGEPEATAPLNTHDDVAVFTWWAEGVEQEGLNALVEVFDKQHPDIDFVNDGVTGGGGSAAKTHLQSRLETQNPPDTFLAHAGAELQDYIKDGHIQDVSDLYDEFGLTEAFPPDLIERLSTDDGKIYSIPSNIHRANVMWVNPLVLEQNELDPSGEYEDLDSFIADLETLREAGIEYPLSIGTTWTQVHLFETVLLADLGTEAYNGLWDGSTDWMDPAVTVAIEHFKTLLSYTNEDRMDLDWQPPTERVIDGESAFNIMGDWALSAFDEQGKVHGEDFRTVPAPGTAGTFDFLADSFTMSTGILDEDGAKAWLETVSSKKGQVEFNKIKGAIPARKDVDTGQFSSYQKQATESFRNDEIVSSLAHGAAVSVSRLNAVTEATSDFNANGDVEAFQAALAASAG